MTDAYTWSSDGRPRPSLRLDAAVEGREVAVTVDDPTAEQFTEALAVFERLAGSLLHRGGAA